MSVKVNHYTVKLERNYTETGQTGQKLSQSDYSLYVYVLEGLLRKV